MAHGAFLVPLVKKSKSSFCHIHVRKPFYYPLPSLTEGKRKLQGEVCLHFDLPSLYSCRTRNPLLRALFGIPVHSPLGFLGIEEEAALVMDDEVRD